MASSSNSKLSPLDAARRAREHVEELFGKPTESISAVAREGAHGWKVMIELVELERIPETTSLIGSYEVQLDGNGALVGAQRVRRYPRNQTDPVPKKEDA